MDPNGKITIVQVFVLISMVLIALTFVGFLGLSDQNQRPHNSAAVIEPSTLLIIIICGALIILLLFFVALPRWVFRVDEQIRLLTQIWRELKKLNHGKE